MNSIENIKSFLYEKRGYLKKSPSALAERLFSEDVTERDLQNCIIALSEVKRELRGDMPVEYYPTESVDIKAVKYYETTSDSPDVPDGLILKSAWQTAGGEMRYSYTKPSTKDIDLGEFQSIKEELIAQLSKNEPIKVDYKEQDQNKESILLEISLPDLHFGKGDTDELLYNFASSLSHLLAQAESTYKIDRILFPIGNDGMNSEGKRQATTKGTPQHDTLDWKSSFVIYCDAIKQAIGLAKTYAPVDVIVIAGNHDYERMLYAGEVVKAYFEKDPDVTVNNGFHPRKYYGYGEVSLMFTHGDKEKPGELALIMATEEPQLFASTRHREIHCGHFHKEMILEDVRGIKTRFLPSICTQDEWHESMGYNSYRSAQALIWHPQQGLKAIFQHNI